MRYPNKEKLSTLLLLAIFVMAFQPLTAFAAGTFASSEHGGVDTTYPDRAYYPGTDGVTGVSRAHIDPTYSTYPRGSCLHCHDWFNPILHWPMLFTDYQTKSTKVDFCGNCHTDADPDANGVDNDTPAGFSFQGPTKFKNSAHYKRNLLWPGGQYGTTYPAMAPAKQGTCVNCHSPHAHSYSSSYATMPAGINPYDIPFPKQLVELTDINEGPGSIAANWPAGWPNVNGRDPDDAEDLCYTCHDGDPVQNPDLSTYNKYVKWGGSPDGNDTVTSIKDAFSKVSHHPVVDSQQKTIADTFGNSTPYAVECTRCHNPHLASGHWEDFFTDPLATPVVLPGMGGDWPPAAWGLNYQPGEAWGDEPEEKMNGLMSHFTGLGTGGWQFNVDRGVPLGTSGLTFDQPPVYRAPEGARVPDGLGGYKQSYQPDGSQLPDFVTFCLDCHRNFAGEHQPIYWGAGFPPGAQAYQPQGHEPHGFDAANAGAFGCGSCGTTGTCGLTSGDGDSVFAGMPRGRGYATWTRGPYNMEDKIAGINFVLACTDCHEPHGSSRRNLFRDHVNGSDMGDQSHNTICNACHYYYAGEMTYQYCGGGGLKSCAYAGCHNAGVCGPSNPGYYCISLHRIQKNNLGGSTVLYKPGLDAKWDCSDNGPGVIGLWHFDDTNTTSGVTYGNKQDSSNNSNDIQRVHKGLGNYSPPSSGNDVANMFTSPGPFGYTGDKSLSIENRTAFASTRQGRCFNFRTPNYDVVPPSEADPASEAKHFSIETWVKFTPTAGQSSWYSVIGDTSYSYQPGWRLLITSGICRSGVNGIDFCKSGNTGPWFPLFQMSTYDHAPSTTDSDNSGDWAAAYSWKEMPENQWVLLSVTFDATRTDNPVRIYMNGMDVTSDEPRDLAANSGGTGNNDTLNYEQPPTGQAINTTTHPYMVNDPKYCPTCASWFKDYHLYGLGLAMGIQANLGNDATDWNWCGTAGNLSTCGWPDPFDGEVDDVRIANVTMTQEEVCARYVNGVAGTPASTTIEPGINVSNCAFKSDPYWEEPYTTQECVTTPSDGSAVARSVVGMWQFNSGMEWLDSSGNGGNIVRVINEDGLIYRDIAGGGAGNLAGNWGTSMPGFGTAWQSNGDSIMRTKPVKCQNMRYPNPNYNSGPSSEATELSVDAWIYPTLQGYSVVYDTGPGTAPTTTVPHAWPFDPANVPGDRPIDMNIMSKFSQGQRVGSFTFSVGGGTCAGGDSFATPNPDYRLNFLINFWDNYANSNGFANMRGVTSSATVPLDQWSYVAATFNANDPTKPMKVYLNGKDVTADLSGANDPDPLVNDYCDQPPTGWAMSTARHKDDCQVATTTTAGNPTPAGTCRSWWVEDEYYRRNPTIGGWMAGLPYGKPLFPSKNYNTQIFPNPWFGKIDDLRFINKQLTPDEVCSRYKEGLLGNPASMTIENNHTAAECP